MKKFLSLSGFVLASLAAGAVGSIFIAGNKNRTYGTWVGFCARVDNIIYANGHRRVFGVASQTRKARFRQSFGWARGVCKLRACFFLYAFNIQRAMEYFLFRFSPCFYSTHRYIYTLGDDRGPYIYVLAY